MTEQERHDRMHPGKICRNCPVEVASWARLQRRIERLGLPWWKRVFTRG